jgi:hypothetical protein
MWYLILWAFSLKPTIVTFHSCSLIFRFIAIKPLPRLLGNLAYNFSDAVVMLEVWSGIVHKIFEIC